MKTSSLAAAVLLLAVAAHAQKDKPRTGEDLSENIGNNLESKAVPAGVQGKVVSEVLGAASAKQGKAVGKWTGMAACKYAGTLPIATPPPALYRVQAGFNLYTQTDGARTDSNVTYLCLLDDSAIFFPGLVGGEDGSVTEEGEYLRVRTFIPGPYDTDKGSKLLSPAQSGQVRAKGGYMVQEDEQGVVKKLAPIDAGADYYIPLKGLKEAIRGSRNLPLANVGKLAWAKVERNYSVNGGKTPAVQVFIHPGDDAAMLMARAVARFTKDTNCSPNGAIAKALGGYVLEAAADPKLGEALKEFASEAAGERGVNATAPSIVFVCKAGTSSQIGDWDVAVPSWNPAKALTVTDGKFDAKSGY